VTDDPITSYLSALKVQLQLNSVLGARVLDEAEDHLRAASEELVASGLSPAEAGEVAVIRFGRAATVARAFAEGAAGSAARNATKWAFASFVVYVAAATAVATAAPRHLLDFPQGLPTWFGLQIAIVALAVSSARWLRWRREPLVPAEASAPLAAGAGIATGALALSAAGEVLLAVTRPAGGWQAGEAEAVIFMAGALLTLAAAVICVAAAARTRTVAALPNERRRTDRLASLIADLGNISPRLGRAAARVLSRPRLTVVVVAAGACLAVTLMQALSDDVAHHASVLVGAGVVGILEAVAVITCYLLFGRSLGLRPGRT
jgi:hypothetical protein